MEKRYADTGKALGANGQKQKEKNGKDETTTGRKQIGTITEINGRRNNGTTLMQNWMWLQRLGCRHGNQNKKKQKGHSIREKNGDNGIEEQK